MDKYLAPLLVSYLFARLVALETTSHDHDFFIIVTIVQAIAIFITYNTKTIESALDEIPIVVIACGAVDFLYDNLHLAIRLGVVLSVILMQIERRRTPHEYILLIIVTTFEVCSWLDFSLGVTIVVTMLMPFLSIILVLCFLAQGNGLAGLGR